MPKQTTITKGSYLHAGGVALQTIGVEREVLVDGVALIAGRPDTLASSRLIKVVGRPPAASTPVKCKLMDWLVSGFDCRVIYWRPEEAR